MRQGIGGSHIVFDWLKDSVLEITRSALQVCRNYGSVFRVVLSTAQHRRPHGVSASGDDRVVAADQQGLRPKLETFFGRHLG